MLHLPSPPIIITLTYTLLSRSLSLSFPFRCTLRVCFCFGQEKVMQDKEPNSPFTIFYFFLPSAKKGLLFIYFLSTYRSLHISRYLSLSLPPPLPHTHTLMYTIFLSRPLFACIPVLSFSTNQSFPVLMSVYLSTYVSSFFYLVNFKDFSHVNPSMVPSCSQLKYSCLN